MQGSPAGPAPAEPASGPIYAAAGAHDEPSGEDDSAVLHRREEPNRKFQCSIHIIFFFVCFDFQLLVPPQAKYTHVKMHVLV